jgi:hypothetical protein
MADQELEYIKDILILKRVFIRSKTFNTAVNSKVIDYLSICADSVRYFMNLILLSLCTIETRPRYFGVKIIVPEEAIHVATGVSGPKKPPCKREIGL